VRDGELCQSMDSRDKHKMKETKELALPNEKLHLTFDGFSSIDKLFKYILTLKIKIVKFLFYFKFTVVLENVIL
jgi:hypothetical protein